MSVFLGAFLGCLLAMFVAIMFLGVCMVIAVIQYKKSQSKKTEELKDQMSSMFNIGGDL